MTIITLPSLVKLLTEEEWRKGAPLTGQEIEQICNKTIQVCIPDNIARTLDPFYGYGDPQESWQVLAGRRQSKRPERD
ncbi:hypothetical protein [Kalamiella sp. sgz302252]|uniref:hypothetical protein n=1 Tax=Pantoea sp. sgz302252 TaxID=3341827 RepID=UPI0036D3BF1D